MLNESLFSSKTDQWETPADLFKKLNDEFHFTLDPCADESNHKCEKYFTKEQNGLIQDWSQDVVFCNPPYGRNIGEWVKKAFESVSSHTHTHTHCCYASSGKDRHKMVSQLHLPQSRNPFHSWKVEVRWFKEFSTIPFNGGCFQKYMVGGDK